MYGGMEPWKRRIPKMNILMRRSIKKKDFELAAQCTPVSDCVTHPWSRFNFYTPP